MHSESTRDCLCGCGQQLPFSRTAPRLVPGHRWKRDVPTLVRFFRHVDYGGPGCWTWRGARKKDTGHGRFEGTTAHRALWIVLHGDPGPGVLIRHRCDNPLCVRPSHHEPGSKADNALDYFRRVGRNDFSGYRRGEAHHKAKLTADDVRAIRAAPCLERGEVRLLAQRYGVNRNMIRMIRNREFWRHVP